MCCHKTDKSQQKRLNSKEILFFRFRTSVSDPDKMTTELRPLKNTKDFLRRLSYPKPHAKPWTGEDGIVHIGLYDFLLNPNSLKAQVIAEVE